MNKIKKIYAICIVIVLVAMMLYGCVGKKSFKSIASNKKVIKIGVCESLSGQYKEMGTSGVLGARYANEMYSTIDIEGEKYKIELVEVDNKSTKDDAEDASKKLLNAKVAFVIGGYNADACMGMVDVLDKANIPTFVCDSPYIELTNGRYCTYRMCKDDTFFASCIASHIKNQGDSDVTILSEKGNRYYDGIIRYFERACESLDLDVLEKKEIDIDDYKKELNDIKNNEPSNILMLFDRDDAVKILKDMRDIGIKANVTSTDMWEYKDVIRDAGSASEGIDFMSSFDYKNIYTEKAKVFLQGDGKTKGFINYLIANGKDEYVYPEAAFSYDAYMIIYNAILDANSTMSEDVIKKIDDITYEGASGVLSFDENGDIKKEVGYIKSIKDGKVVSEETINLDNIG